MPGRLSLLAAVVTLLSLASCAVLHTVPRSDVTAPSPESAHRFTRFSTPKGQRVFGYTTVDGRFHRLSAWARLAGDTVVFRSTDRAVTERLAVADVQSVRSEAIAWGPTALLATGFAGFAGVFIYGAFFLPTMRPL